MSHDDAQTLIDRLDDLLEQERVALLQGDLEAIATLLENKERLIDALNALTESDRPEMEGVEAKVRRNQALLDGALQGIRHVAARMAALRRVRRGLETYDAKGAKSTIEGEAEYSVEKRA
jgi:flagellar biosynthesis/type III secretory pathway chaperone